MLAARFGPLAVEPVTPPASRPRPAVIDPRRRHLDDASDVMHTGLPPVLPSLPQMDGRCSVRFERSAMPLLVP